MAYDIKSGINGILNNKAEWQIGNNTHDTKKKNTAAQNAQKIYDELRKNGYAAVANKLSSYNYDDAKKYAQKYFSMAGKSEFRPYMYEKGGKFGLSQADIDNLITYNDDTGEVSFAGKNIGRPDGIANNRSYFSPEYLDSVWDGYVKDSGITPSETDMYKQQLYSNKMNYDELTGQQKDIFDYIIRTNDDTTQVKKEYMDKWQNPDKSIYDTPTARSIMDKFNYLGGVASGNAVADGAGSNSGNIDSFSAANAARQQLAFTSAGTDAVIAEAQNRMNSVLQVLDGLGVQNQGAYAALHNNLVDGTNLIKVGQDNAQQTFDNQENRKLNDQAIKNDEISNLIKQAAVTGYIPDEFLYSNNPYINKDGSLKNINMDYNAKITELEKALKAETNPERISSIKWNLRWLEQARDKKTATPEYSKFAGDRTSMYNVPLSTVDVNQFNAQMENALKLAKLGNESNERLTELEGKNAINLENTKGENERANIETAAKHQQTEPKLSASEATEAIKRGEISQSIIDAYNYHYGTSYTVDNPPKPKDSDDSWTTDNTGSGDDEVEVLDNLGKIDEKRIKTAGVDQFGRQMIEALTNEQTKRGGVLTTDEVIKFMVDNSAIYNTDKKQLEKVLAYLGMGVNYLDDVENKSWNWKDGVKFVKK